MAPKTSVSPSDSTVNGRLDATGEATDGAHVADGDLSFDPAELEADAPAAPATSPGHDPFDPAFLGLSQDFAAEANVAKEWDIIKVEKPATSRVIHVHPSKRLMSVLLTLKEDNASY